MASNIDLDTLIEAAACAWDTDADAIRAKYGKRRDSAARIAVVAILREQTDWSLEEIGESLSHSRSGIALSLKRLANYRRNRDWKQRYVNLRDALSLN